MVKQNKICLAIAVFMQLYPVVFLAILRFLGHYRVYSWLKSDYPQKFVSITTIFTCMCYTNVLSLRYK